MSRIILPVLISVLVLAGCAGRQEKIEAQNRRPLRDIFPPPSLEQQAGADQQKSAQSGQAAGKPPEATTAQPAPPQQASVAPPSSGARTPPQQPAAASSSSGPRTPPSQQAQAASPSSGARTAPQSVEPIAGLEAPSLEQDRPLFNEEGGSPGEEALGVGGGSLAEEFGLKSPPPSPDAGEPALAQENIATVEPIAPAPDARGQAQAAATPEAAAREPRSGPSAPTGGQAEPRPSPTAPPTSRVEPMPAPAPPSRSEAQPRPMPPPAAGAVTPHTAAPATGVASPPAASTDAQTAQTAKRPPRIVFSTRPALLVPIYGEPRLKPVEGTALMRVENSPAIILKGKSGNYYIPVYDGFVQAKRLSGPWTVTKSPPKVLTTAKTKLIQAGQQDLFAGRPEPGGRSPSLALGAPRIVIGNQPTALIVVDGQPGYQKVRNTRVSRLINTQSRVFRNDADGSIYVQIGDDWYRAKSTKGPWRFIPSDDLPPDFEGLKGG